MNYSPRTKHASLAVEVVGYRRANAVFSTTNSRCVLSDRCSPKNNCVAAPLCARYNGSVDVYAGAKTIALREKEEKLRRACNSYHRSYKVRQRTQAKYCVFCRNIINCSLDKNLHW